MNNSNNTLNKVLNDNMNINMNMNMNINYHFFPNKPIQVRVVNNKQEQHIDNLDNESIFVSLLEKQQQLFKEAGLELCWQQPQELDIKTLDHDLIESHQSYSQIEMALQALQQQAQENGLELILSQRPSAMQKQPWRVKKGVKKTELAEPIIANNSVNINKMMKVMSFVNQLTMRFPLHITLMLQSTLSPKVQLIVRAPFAGAEWCFVAAKGRYPTDDLLDEMQGKSITYGWDAIVVYQQSTANKLLQQQHIKRFVDENSLPPVSAVFESAKQSRILAHNLTLSAPRLSFETANLQKSEATLTMDFIKGLVVFAQEDQNSYQTVQQIDLVSPIMSPQLTMKVDLTQAPGTVTDKGEVEIDIASGDNFNSTLVMNKVEQQTVGLFFRERFQKIAKEKRKYYLGGFSSFENEQLKPKNFTIRTMAAPNGKSLGTQDSGDGAIVLFTTLEGGKKGAIPLDMNWLLVDDYRASLVLSNKRIFNDILKQPITNGIGNGVEFKPYSVSGSPDKAWSLQAISGEFNFAFWGVKEQDFMELLIQEMYICIVTSGSIVMGTGNDNLLTVKPNRDKLSFEWSIPSESEFFKFDYHGGLGSDRLDENGKVIPGHENNYYVDKCTLRPGIFLVTDYYLGLNDDNEVYFVPPKGWSDNTHIDFSAYIQKFYKEQQMVVSSFMEEFFAEELKTKLLVRMRPISLPSINTFAVRNLLFPGGNTFQTKKPCLPGDLLLLGDLDATQATFAIKPIETVIGADTSFTFTTEPATSDVKWSVFSTEDENVDLGTIDAKTGIYKAPKADTLPDGVRYVVICAEKENKRTFAKACIVARDIIVSPLYQIVQPKNTVTLKAESISDEELIWELPTSKQNSVLTEVSNNEYQFVAGPKKAKLDYNLERVKVSTKNGAQGEALVLVANR